MNEKEIIGEYIQPEKSLTERLNQLESHLAQQGPLKQKKQKKFRMPMKGKVSKARLNKGYVTVIEIFENDTIDFKREQIIDGTVKLDDTYHDVDELDILTYKARPAVIIPKKSKYPYNPNRSKPKNDTYAQKHIMSRMMNEAIDAAKKKLSLAGMSIGGIILIGIVAYAFIAG